MIFCEIDPTLKQQSKTIMDCITGNANTFYMKGAGDMLEALRTVSSWTYEEMQKYCPGDYTNSDEGLWKMLRMNPGDIISAVEAYKENKRREKDKQDKSAVRALARIFEKHKCKNCKYWKLEDELPWISEFMECTRVDESDPDWYLKWHFKDPEQSCEHWERKP